MGWLSFLSRKSSSIGRDYHLKAQAYDETVAAKPPIRGTYPVAGNGPSIWEKFQKSHPHLKDAELNDTSAPPPAVPRLSERPNTAPNHQAPEGSTRPKSQSGTSTRVLREPPKKRHGPYRLPSKIPVDDVSNRNSIYNAPSPTFTRNRNSSIFSGDSGSMRRFVDLLDAQSFIKPSDFHGRVKAIGTKDYGEDVADRNIIDNGFINFNPVHSSKLHNVQSGDNEDDPLPLPNKRHSMGPRLRSKSSSYNSHGALPKVASLQTSPEYDNEDERNSARKASRRRSLHSYVPSSSADRPRSSSRGKGVKVTDPKYFPDSLRERARAAAKGDLERDSYANLRTENKSSQLSRKDEKASVYEEDSNTETPSYHTRNGSKHNLPVQAEKQLSNKESRRRTMSHVSSFTSFKSTSSKRNSLQSLVSSRKGPIAEGSLASVEEGLRERRNRNSSRRLGDSLADFDGSFSELPPLRPLDIPQLRSIRSRPNSKDELGYRHGNRSVTSVSKRGMKRSEVEDTILELGSSSVRRWSLTSETAGSTLSSNPFRPQSGHTTNTSIDLAPRVPPPKSIKSSHTPSTSRDYSTALESQAEASVHETLYPEEEPDLLANSFVDSGRRRPSPDFIVEEDASSVDSFNPPQRPIGEFEKDLLFQGYGFEGAQLPGLPGLFDAAIPKAETIQSRRTRAYSVHKGPLHLAAFSPSLDDRPRSASGPQYSTRSSHYGRSSRLQQMPTFNYSDSENDDSSEQGSESEDMNFDIPKTRSNTSRYDSRSSSRLRYEKTSGKLGEDDLDFPDTTAQIARLRREAKSAQRASNQSLRSKANGKGKARDIGVPRIGLDDPSSYADVES